MKKRLLSAFLALAMVLTLLPVSAFAAVEYKDPVDLLPNGSGATYTDKGTNPQPHPYYDDTVSTRITTVSVEYANQTNYTDGRVYGNWYWLKNKGTDADNPQYCRVTSGIIAGVNGKGNWYPDVSKYTRALSNGDEQVTGAFTVLGTANVDLSSYVNTSLTIDVANTATITGVPAAINTLTLTSKYAPSGTGTVQSITTDRIAYDNADETRNGLTITATGMNIGAITMQGRTNTLNLTRCNVTGAVSMDGAYLNSSTATVNSYATQKITASNCTFQGITVTNSRSSTLDLKDCTTGAIDVTSDAGSVKVSGLSRIQGNITTKPQTISGAWPSIEVSGGTLNGLVQGDYVGNSNSIKMTVGTTTSTTKVTGIIVKKGDVTITSADVGGYGVYVNAGSLSITGTGVDVDGKLHLGATDKTTLSITAKQSTFGGITAIGDGQAGSTNAADYGANLTISNWEGSRWPAGNYYGELTLGGYAGKKITGGSFDKANNENAFRSNVSLPWFDTNNTLGFLVLVDSGSQPAGVTERYDLYKKTELAQAISDISTAKAAAEGHINVLCQGKNGAGKQNITLMNGDVVWAMIGYDESTPLYLPSKINNVSITKWVAETDNKPSYNPGESPVVPYQAGGMTLNASGTAAVVSKITKAVAAANPPVVQNQNVTVKFTEGSTTIALSGAVVGNSQGVASIYLDLTTDAVDTNGNPIVLRNVLVDYNVNTKAVSFNGMQPTTTTNAGVRVVNGVLELNSGTGAKYTVTANFSVPTSLMDLASSTEVQTTLSGDLSRWTDTAKKNLTDTINGGTFTINNNAAVLEAINAAQATITSDTTVQNWIANAKENVWKNGIKDADGNYITIGTTRMVPHAGKFDSSTPDGAVIASNFNKAYIVPYLVVNVSKYDAQAGTMTATLSPYYRVDISASTGYVKANAYTAQAGRAMAALTGDMMTSPVQVNLNLPATFNSQYMHQDGKYVYRGNTGTWTINHAGANGTLGTVSLDAVVGPISMSSGIANRNPAVPTLTNGYTYDNLQAAVDDTVPGKTVVNDDQTIWWNGQTYDTITVNGNYSGSGSFTMTGLARTILIDAKGMEDVKCSSQNVRMQTAGAYQYVFQLERDNVVTPTGNVTISVASVNNGSAKVSASKAKAGDTITITASPSNGYGVSSMSVRTDTGATVPTTSTSTNVYTFKVPEGAKSITVTPAFAVTSTATITVNNPSNGGLAVTNASNNRAKGGSTITVTTTPYNGYQTTGVTVTANTGTVAVSRIAENRYTFVVPANATTITVTPSFGRNDMPFIDVPANSSYAEDVRFVYNHGLMAGDGSTVIFNGSGNVTRGQLVTILYRLSNSPSSSVYNKFVDCNPSAYYAQAVTWAYNNGIVGGNSANTFAPNSSISRQDFATILYRYNQYRGQASGSPSNLAGYTDRNNISGYAQEAMQWAVGNGIIGGTTYTTLTPLGTASRYQTATMLARYCRNFLGMR